jgi:hypothetical protein
MRKRIFWICLIVLTVVITVPYILAATTGGKDFHFAGFLINPLDGNSYLAKMQEGWSGSWTFNLLYSPQFSGGAYIFLFYLFLGHLARWLSISPILIFHIFRVLSTWFLLYELKLFFNQIFADKPELSEKAFIWTVFGTGLGWVALLFGIQTSDIWVAEAYPFLACYANPHFPLALALLLYVLRIAERGANTRNLFLILFCGLALGIILPFGVVIGGLIIFISSIWNWINQKKLVPWQLICFGVGGTPSLIYQYYVVKTNPELAIWNQQNLTPAPPIWNFIIAFLPAIIFTVIGIVTIFKKRVDKNYKPIIIWFLVGIVLTFIPFSLQRRFMLGLYIPIIALAVIGMRSILKSDIWFKRITVYSVAASVMTSFFVITIGLFGVISHSSMLYLTQDKYDTLVWVKTNSAKDNVILANPITSMYIPGITGKRVVYGHPFESINADEQKNLVESFFSGKLSLTQEQIFLENNHVNYIIHEKDEKISTAELFNYGFIQVKKIGDIVIYQKQ